jgi:hypothetical protein
MLQIDGDAEHTLYPAREGFGHEAMEVLAVGLEANAVEMAVGIDEHGVSLFHL